MQARRGRQDEGEAAAAPPAEGGEEGEEEILTWCNPADPMGAWLNFRVGLFLSHYLSSSLLVRKLLYKTIAMKIRNHCLIQNKSLKEFACHYSNVFFKD